MYGKAKRLRDRGARLSDQDSGRAPFVEGIHHRRGMDGTSIAEVSDPSSQTGGGLIWTSPTPVDISDL
jgi:hypothetical protein